MSVEDRSILILDIAERAIRAGRLGTNYVARYKSIEVTERQLLVIERNDFVEWENGAIFISGRGRNRKGTPEVQIWWADPRCPRCQKRGILHRIENEEEWKIECCGVIRRGGVRDICLAWLGYCQRRY